LFNILSIGGMPPLLGIFPKIIVIFNFSNFSCQEIFILSALILSSVVTLFFYLKIAYSIVILYNFKPSPSFQNLNIFNSWFSLFVSCSILGNFLIIPVISLF
jgi:NADH-ubiquinone oxidoreductase chain 2